MRAVLSMIVSILLLIWMAGIAAAQPSIASGGISNAASGATTIAPGSLVSLFGSQLASTPAQGDSIPLSATINDVFVTVNGVRAPLLFVAPGQINAQMPWDLGAGGSASVVVSRGGVTSAPATVQVAPAAPGLFMVPGGTQAIAVNNADGTLAAPSGSIQGLTTHGAKPGDVLILYATGLGAVNPAVQSGHNSLDQLRWTVGTPTVLIGGVAARVDYSGLTPQFPGVNQLNVVVPAGVPPGASVPIEIQMGGRSHQATIAITQ
jgi:uncharacterized protein (TIGR03437 family)